MKNLTYSNYLADPSAREQIEQAARRTRSETLRRFLVAPALRLCGSLLRMPTVVGPRPQIR